MTNHSDLLAEAAKFLTGPEPEAYVRLDYAADLVTRLMDALRERRPTTIDAEKIDDWIDRANIALVLRLPENRPAVSHFLMEALSHFAPAPRPEMQIDGMRAEEIADAFLDGRLAGTQGAAYARRCADVAYRLANTPKVAPVDPDADARECYEAWWCGVTKSKDKMPSAHWTGMRELDKDGWRALAKLLKSEPRQPCD